MELSMLNRYKIGTRCFGDREGYLGQKAVPLATVLAPDLVGLAGREEGQGT